MKKLKSKRKQIISYLNNTAQENNNGENIKIIAFIIHLGLSQEITKILMIMEL